MQRRSKLLTLSILLFCLQANGQASEPGIQINWKEAVRLATENNPTLKAARDSVEASESRLKSSKWNLAPTLSGQIGLNRDGRDGNDNGSAYSTTLGLSQSLLNFSNYGSIAQARANTDRQSAALLVTRAALNRDLKTSFSSTLYSQESMKLVSSIIARRKRNLELVQLRFEGGRENKGAVLLSQANLDEAQLSFLQAENAFRTSKIELLALLGLGGEQSLALTNDIPTDAPPAGIDFKTYADRSPERLQALASEQESGAAVRTARGQLLPRLGLTANLGKYGDRFLPQTDGWSVGLSLTIPLVDGSNYHSIQAARAEASASSQKRQATENDLLVRVHQTYDQYVEAVQREKVASTFVNATRTRAEIARQRYEAGLISFDEWDRIESDLITRETANLQASRNRVTAEAAWEYVIGEGDIL